MKQDEATMITLQAMYIKLEASGLNQAAEYLRSELQALRNKIDYENFISELSTLNEAEKTHYLRSVGVR